MEQDAGMLNWLIGLFYRKKKEGRPVKGQVWRTKREANRKIAVVTVTNERATEFKFVLESKITPKETICAALVRGTDDSMTTAWFVHDYEPVEEDGDPVVVSWIAESEY